MATHASAAMANTSFCRRLPVGAEASPAGGTHFRIWAPDHPRVELLVEAPTASEPRRAELKAEGDGYHALFLPDVGPGDLYRFRIGGEVYADPASRFQPGGPEGPSQIVDPTAFPWTDRDWPGVKLKGQVIYEMHIGTFTPEGTWEAAMDRLPDLANLGVTLLEVMPVADFCGRFGWGYDGVDFFAPTRLYGTPDDFRRFIDRAHLLGLGVMLDVVFNHIGPKGNCLTCFAEDYVTDRYQTDWGPAINFDGENSLAVREFFLANVEHWIGEYHLDGLRIDATQNIYDRSADHILAAIVRQARAAAGRRSVLLIGENEPQDTRLVRPPERGGYGLDALWNDDFHHSAVVALSGRSEAYFTDHRGEPQEFISAAKYGYLYQGQYYHWQKNRRGTPSFDIEPARFVNFIENHDQIANCPGAARTHLSTSPGRYRAMVALTLLSPGTPMLFQGQEFAASSPFFYFADHDGELADMVDRGRKEFVAQFPRSAETEMQRLMPRPSDPDTFQRSKLDWSDRARNAGIYAMYCELLRLRREDPVLSAQRHRGLDGAVLGEEAFLLRFFGAEGDDRLLVVNLGADAALEPVPEPLLAPPLGKRWQVIWSSEHPRYGGLGTPPPEDDHGCWTMIAHSAIVLAPVAPADEEPAEERDR
jgi:maltooligosyltrehalose trehalohydrolase